MISRRQFLRKAGRVMGALALSSTVLNDGCAGANPGSIGTSSPQGMTTPSTVKTINPTTQTIISSQPPTILPTLRPTQTAIDALDGLILANPATVDASGLPVTPIDLLHVANTGPPMDASTYTLMVYGLVGKPLTITRDMLQNYPRTSQVVLLICPGFFADNPQWSGIPVSAILSAAEVKTDARMVFFHSSNDVRLMPVADAFGDGVFLADMVDGQPLPPEHGYPLRLVRRGFYGSDWLKWVIGIEIT
jgi:DMSO/TMAO reductase YedYZ molybdopterin-dependent catalytic subunit